MSKIECPRCKRQNAPGERFCSACGASIEAQVQCPVCSTLQAIGNRYCNSCGAETAGAPSAGGPAAGAVIGGVWERSASEFIRRVDPEDARSFLGSRVVVVPTGTVGVVMVDGVVERILPPGQQTTLGLFERVANFFTGRGARTAFYLVDQRPIPIAFAVATRPSAAGHSVETQVLVSFSLQRGNRDGIAAFIANVVGDRAGYAASDLFSALRPDVTRTATAVLERLAAAGEVRYAEAEGAIRDELTRSLGARYGLGIDVSVAPLTATASLDFHLGTGQAPRVRTCRSCNTELPATMKVCDHCGERQLTLLSPDRRCASCSANVPEGNKFCDGCGKPFVAPPASASPLFTADGEQVELDLVVRVRGQSQDFSAERIAPALVGGAAAHLRGVALARCSTAAGFAAMEEAMQGSAQVALESFGLTLVSLSVVDIRSKTGQWLLGARADLSRAQKDIELGREWLAQREGEVDLQGLAFGQALRAQRGEREAKLGQLALELEVAARERTLRSEDGLTRAQAELADRQRRQGLADGAATLDVNDARRSAARDIDIKDAEQRAADAERARRHDKELDELRHGMSKEDAVFTHEAGITRSALELEKEKRRQELGLDSERARQQADDAAFAARAKNDVGFEDHERRKRLDIELAATAEQQQIAKLAAMAELAMKGTAQEQAHEKAMRESLKGLSEREMIAAQASALAKSEGGGAAWAQALGSQGAVEAEARHARELRELVEKQAATQHAASQAELDRMQRLSEKVIDSATAQKQGAAGGEIYERSMDAMSRVAASRAAAAPVVASVSAPTAATSGPPCKECGAPLRDGARFCGGCGSPQ